MKTSQQLSAEIAVLHSRITELKKQLAQTQKLEKAETQNARMKRLETLAVKAGILDLNDDEIQIIFAEIQNRKEGKS
ncbi:MAG: hypothetical protein KGI54_18590 [Pseudomonadota bacterium]|nr:hypothetical protein [Pseudomonadota bacterium]